MNDNDKPFLMKISEPPTSRYRWVICFLLFAATTINYIDRQILSLLKPMLDDVFGWSSTQFGAINSAFQASYALSLLFFGWFVDRYGTKIGYTLSIGLWSLAAMGHALVNSISGFFGARIALGIGEGGNFPSAIKATAQWFPRNERALATSLLNSGANAGAMIAPAIVPAIALSLGWHWPFLIAGFAGLVWIAIWWPLFSDPAESRRVSAGELALIQQDGESEGDKESTPWKSILRHREAWSFITSKFLTDPVWWFFLIWLPDFFKKTRGLDIKSSWTLLVSIYSIITVLSIAGGWITGHLASRGWSITRARKSGLLLFAICALPIATVTWVGDWTAVLLIGLAGAAHQAWSATLFTTVSDMFPRSTIAKLIGVGGMAGSIGGMIFPLITGIVLDSCKSGYAMIFGYCSLAYLLAFALNNLLAPSYKPIKLGK